MDCYPEYKHHIHPNHQHYNSNVAANHSYYPGNYGPTSMRYSHAHSYPEGSQQPNWAEGYSRYNHAQHHLNHQGNYSTNTFTGHYGPTRENYHANGETTGQFYYQNAHQTSASYYGNHSYDSYRNASSGYPYHYGGAAYHQTGTAPPPTQYYPSYNSPSNEQFNNRYYPTPPPSAPPASSSSSHRDPFTLAHSSNGSPSSSSSSYAASVENELNGSLKKEERLSIEVGEKISSIDRVESMSAEKQSSGPVDDICKSEVKDEIQQTELGNSSSPHSTTPNENEKPRMECVSEAAKVDGTLESAENQHKVENHQQQSPSLFNETGDHNQHHHPCNETLTKPTSVTQESTSACEAESSIATGKWATKIDFQVFDFHGKSKKKKLKKRKKTILLSSLWKFDCETCN